MYFKQITSNRFFITKSFNLIYKQFYSMDESIKYQTIKEGSAEIRTYGKVFYNPVQEFNRDLSLTVLKVFSRSINENSIEKRENSTEEKNDVNVIIGDEKVKSYENGITILEALSATCLRSIRYAKEVPGIKKIIANDISEKAIQCMKENVKLNNVDDLIETSCNDAVMLMYQHKRDKCFDAIDLDPYGCPSIFLDSAVQSVKDGGMLLVTATDMAVLAGNSPETCYAKYGSVSLKIRCCHEMALRILLQCIESHANRYGRYIVPMLSISADFYIRVFVRVYTGPNKCKQTTSKLSMVYHCTGCDTFTLQPLGVMKLNEKNKQVKYGLPTGPPVKEKCEHCNGSHHVGGPIWTGALHSQSFVQDVLQSATENLVTYKRIQGVLNVILEELDNCPLYYTLEKITSTLHCETPPMLTFRSAILNAGYQVSYTHMHKNSIKTNAPAKVIWDIMRCWIKNHPINKKRSIENTPAYNIAKIEPEKDYSFNMHPDANPMSRKLGFVRFQANPLPHWGPGTRATAMIGEAKIQKSRRNQGKRKRDESVDSKEDD